MQYLMIFLTTFGADRITKSWALANLQNGTISVFPGLNLLLSWNRGISWGLFDQTTTTGFYTLTAFIIAIIVFFMFYTISELKKNHCVGFEFLVISGAISNLFDRFWYGAVIDFIDVYAGAWHWPTFNIADACIVVGVIGILGKEVLYGCWNQCKKS